MSLEKSVSEGRSIIYQLYKNYKIIPDHLLYALIASRLSLESFESIKFSRISTISTLRGRTADSLILSKCFERRYSKYQAAHSVYRLIINSCLWIIRVWIC